MSAELDKKPKPVELAHCCLNDAEPQEKDDDVPLILIHGLSMNKHTWMGVDKELALKTGRKVYTIDLRNHGGSPWSDEYDIEAMTEDVIHFMDNLDISKAIVLGHSLGGKTAVHLALNYPTRIEKIIVEDMRPNGISSEGLEEVHDYMRIYQEVEKAFDQGITEKEAIDMLISLLMEQVQKMDQPPMKRTDSSVPISFSEGKCKFKFNPKLLTVALNDIMDMLTESIGCFEGPSLFIYGAQSNFKVNEDESNIKKLFPNATLFGVEGATHNVHVFPEFVDVVVKFISEN